MKIFKYIFNKIYKLGKFNYGEKGSAIIAYILISVLEFFHFIILITVFFLLKKIKLNLNELFYYSAAILFFICFYFQFLHKNKYKKFVDNSKIRFFDIIFFILYLFGTLILISITAYLNK